MSEESLSSHISSDEYVFRRTTPEGRARSSIPLIHHPGWSYWTSITTKTGVLMTISTIDILRLIWTRFKIEHDQTHQAVPTSTHRPAHVTDSDVRSISYSSLSSSQPSDLFSSLTLFILCLPTLFSFAMIAYIRYISPYRMVSVLTALVFTTVIAYVSELAYSVFALKCYTTAIAGMVLHIILVSLCVLCLEDALMLCKAHSWWDGYCQTVRHKYIQQQQQRQQSQSQLQHGGELSIGNGDGDGDVSEHDSLLNSNTNTHNNNKNNNTNAHNNNNPNDPYSDLIMPPSPPQVSLPGEIDYDRTRTTKTVRALYVLTSLIEVVPLWGRNVAKRINKQLK